MNALESPVTSESGTARSPGQFIQTRKRRRSSTSLENPTREYGLMRDTGKSDATRFVGSGSGIHFIRNVYMRLASKSSVGQAVSEPGNDLVPGEDDQLCAGTTARGDGEQSLWKPHEISPVQTSQVDKPTFEQLVVWTKSYFEHWHVAFPYLHAPDALDLLEEVSMSGIETLGQNSQVIVKSIMSISLADRRQCRSTTTVDILPSNLVFDTIHDAMNSVQFILGQPASLQNTQAALSIQLFLVSMLRLNSASRLGGLVVRMAFQLGLHRCPVRFPIFSSPEAQLRRRVFWCIYITERFLSQSLGLPLDIRDDDIDVCYPGEERHEVVNSSDDSYSANSARETGRLQLLKYIAKHARIRGLILELRNKAIVSRQDTVETAEVVHAELAKWANEIHDAAEFDDDGDNDDDDELDRATYTDTSQGILAPGHKLLLLLLKYEATISLNRPMMASADTGSFYAAALQNCIFAARSVFKTTRKYQNRFKYEEGIDDTGLIMPMVWPSFTWTIWISAFVLVYAAVEGQLHLNSALRLVISQLTLNLLHIFT
jgi:hypothetical protein